jgi:hypothetical protein
MTLPKERFTKHVVSSDYRPKNSYTYWVTGRGHFPLDMLRYDACWPVSTTDALKIVTERPKTVTEARAARSIEMCSYQEPTVDRWSSFGWSVGKQRLDTPVEAIGEVDGSFIPK